MKGGALEFDLVPVQSQIYWAAEKVLLQNWCKNQRDSPQVDSHCLHCLKQWDFAVTTTLGDFFESEIISNFKESNKT